MGPMPKPTPTGDKRRYIYSVFKDTQRPLIQPIKSQPRFKQEPPQFDTWASAEERAGLVHTRIHLLELLFAAKHNQSTRTWFHDWWG